MKLPYFASVLCSALLGGTLCDQSDEKTEFASQQEVEELRKQIASILNFNDALEELVADLEFQLNLTESEQFEDQRIFERAETTGDRIQNRTIKERVAILEFQVDNINSDISDLEQSLLVVEDEQEVQGQEIAELQLKTDGLKNSTASVEELAISVNNRVSIVNYTLTKETEELKGELKLVENSIGVLADALNDTVERVTVVEDEVAEIENRIGQLEVDGTVGFQVYLSESATIPIASIVVFNEVSLNIGNGYDSATGRFTVPAGETGLYYFYTDLYTNDPEDLYFAIRVNEQFLCRAILDIFAEGPDDNGSPSCGAVALLEEGDIVDVYYYEGTTDMPLSSYSISNSFLGFRIAAE